MKNDLDELDLAIFHAIEISPRASWAKIGAAVGVDPVTAARRWEALQDESLAWVSCHPLLTRETAGSFVELECRVDAVRAVAAVVARDPRASTVEIVSGSSDIFVFAVGTSREALSDFILDRLSAIPGVTKVSSQPVVAIHVESGYVAAGSLQRSALDLFPTERRGTLVPSKGRVDDLDWELCLELSRDGRASIATLARATETPESTVKRRLSKLTADGALHIRARLAPRATSGIASVWLGIQVPPADMGDAISALSRIPGVTSVSVVAGPSNLVARVTLPHIAILEAFESRIQQATPTIRIASRMVVLEVARFLSRVVDRQGKASEIASVDIR